jgi:hypothetical protein
MAMVQVLAVSELKGQRMAQGVIEGIIDLSHTVLVSSRQSSTLAQSTVDLLTALTTKRQKLLHFRVTPADPCDEHLLHKLNQVLTSVDQIVAPRREKYTV